MKKVAITGFEMTTIKQMGLLNKIVKIGDIEYGRGDDKYIGVVAKMTEVEGDSYIHFVPVNGDREFKLCSYPYSIELVAEFEVGQKIYASDDDPECGEEFEYRFISKHPLIEGAVITCAEDDFEALKEGDNDVRLYPWKYAVPIVKPIWDSIKIELNDEYTAQICEDKVVVGCQEISFETIHEIYKAVQKAEKFVKDNN